MQQVDKNGTKTILRLNEVVSKRRKSNSLSSSSASRYRLKESDVVANNSNSGSQASSANSNSSSKLTMTSNTISDICSLPKASSALVTPVLIASTDKLESAAPAVALFDVKDKRVQFLVEFTAGALGGALSRTAYVWHGTISFHSPGTHSKAAVKNS